MFFIRFTKRWVVELQPMRHLVVATLPVVAGTRLLLFWNSKPSCSWELINSLHCWLSWIKNRKIYFKKDEKYIKFRPLNRCKLLQLLRWIPGCDLTRSPIHSVIDTRLCLNSPHAVLFFFLVGFLFLRSQYAVGSLNRFEQVFACKSKHRPVALLYNKPEKRNAPRRAGKIFFQLAWNDWRVNSLLELVPVSLCNWQSLIKPRWGGDSIAIKAQYSSKQSITRQVEKQEIKQELPLIFFCLHPSLF